MNLAPAEFIPDPLPIPTSCDICGAAVEYVNNDEVYGKSYGKWPWVWRCTRRVCRAYVGTHPGTNIPLGKLADAETRRWRQEAHQAFDPLWRNGSGHPKHRFKTRRKAYGWLASQLQIPLADCHIAMFDIPTCQKVVQICK